MYNINSDKYLIKIDQEGDEHIVFVEILKMRNRLPYYFVQKCQMFFHLKFIPLPGSLNMESGCLK